MNDYSTLAQARPEVRRQFMTSVYRWMVLALAVSGASAFLVASSTTILRFIYGNSFVLIGLVIGELALVFYLSLNIRNMTPGTAFGCFMGYSVLNGITLSSIFMIYNLTSIVTVFAVTAAMFLGMSIYGMKTRNDLNSAGRYLMMAVMGIIVASIINMLLRSSGLDWLISIVSVVVFTGLTAYDTQKLMQLSVYNDGSANFRKAAVIGALELYLDFINIFLELLRLFGRRD